uniref:Homoserine kinase n=1 Tax=Lygus hesperus TaxID=30085 RepID=A0A0A9YDA0_LYGHE
MYSIPLPCTILSALPLLFLVLLYSFLFHPAHPPSPPLPTTWLLCPTTLLVGILSALSAVMRQSSFVPTLVGTTFLLACATVSMCGSRSTHPSAPTFASILHLLHCSYLLHLRFLSFAMVCTAAPASELGPLSTPFSILAHAPLGSTSIGLLLLHLPTHPTRLLGCCRYRCTVSRRTHSTLETAPLSVFHLLGFYVPPSILLFLLFGAISIRIHLVSIHFYCYSLLLVFPIAFSPSILSPLSHSLHQPPHLLPNSTHLHMKSLHLLLLLPPHILVYLCHLVPPHSPLPPQFSHSGAKSNNFVAICVFVRSGSTATAHPHSSGCRVRGCGTLHVPTAPTSLVVSIFASTTVLPYSYRGRHPVLCNLLRFHLLTHTLVFFAPHHPLGHTLSSSTHLPMYL